MRIIPDDFLDLVAGGRAMTTNDVTGIPSVTVYGDPGDDGGDDGGDSGGYGWTPVLGYGSDGGDPIPVSDPVIDSTHHTSPPPPHVPNVNLDALRTFADDAGKQLLNLTAIDGKEHGVLIVLTADGSLKSGPVSTGSEDQNTAHYDPQPGDKIVAWIHDHPTVPGVNEARPSNTDVQSIRDLVGNTAVVDPNALMYIADQETGYTYEYDRAVNFNVTRTGSNISTDHQ